MYRSLTIIVGINIHWNLHTFSEASLEAMLVNIQHKAPEAVDG